MRAIAIALMMMSASVQAGVVGVLNGATGSIYLHDEARVCVGGAWYAQWRGADGSTVDGCWKMTQAGAVQVAFFDGDAAVAPVELVRQPQGL